MHQVGDQSKVVLRCTVNQPSSLVISVCPSVLMEQLGSHWTDLATFDMFGVFFENLSKVFQVKVKVTLVQALRLCTGRMTHRGSRGIALLFHDQRH